MDSIKPLTESSKLQMDAAKLDVIQSFTSLRAFL